jgi:hypothetical protein
VCVCVFVCYVHNNIKNNTELKMIVKED